MLSKNESTAIAVENEMKSVYNNLGLDHHTYVTTMNHTGVRFV
jgi:homoserine kinase